VARPIPRHRSRRPAPEPLPPICPTGFVHDGHKCALESEARAYRCAPGDRAACTTQCEAGSAESCHNLLEDEGKSEEAKAIYGDVCDRMKYPPYCKAFTRLGGKLPKGFKTFDHPRQPDDF
jgi:hypothetical protein